jgi:hypothetical protein
LTTGAATVLAAAAGGDDDRSSENIDQQVASRNLKQQGTDGTLSVELPLRYPKTLMGIFSSDGFNDSSYRKRHRTLLQVSWKDPRTCTLAEYRRHPEIRDQCQLIYTFIIGGNVDADAPTELLENRPDLGRPLVLDQMANPSREDVNADDVTLLNIRYAVVHVAIEIIRKPCCSDAGLSPVLVSLSTVVNDYCNDANFLSPLRLQ